MVCYWCINPHFVKKVSFSNQENTLKCIKIAINDVICFMDSKFKWDVKHNKPIKIIGRLDDEYLFIFRKMNADVEVFAY